MALKESKKLEQANSYELVVTVDGETFEKALNTVTRRKLRKLTFPVLERAKLHATLLRKCTAKKYSMMTLCRIAILRLFTTQQKRQA